MKHLIKLGMRLSEVEEILFEYYEDKWDFNPKERKITVPYAGVQMCFSQRKKLKTIRKIGV